MDNHIKIYAKMNKKNVQKYIKNLLSKILFIRKLSLKYITKNYLYIR